MHSVEKVWTADSATRFRTLPAHDDLVRDAPYHANDGGKIGDIIIA